MPARLRFVLHSENGGRAVMEFELHATDVARRFSELLDRIDNSTSNLIPVWGMDIDQRRRQSVLDGLNNALERYNSIAEDPLTETPVADDVDQRLLNQLHQEFERRATRLRAGLERQETTNSRTGPESFDDEAHRSQLYALLTINRQIHMLESLLLLPEHHSGTCLSAWFSATMADKYGKAFCEPLRDEDYDSFTLAETFGALYLGYGIVGKNLHQIYLSDDLEFLTSGNKATAQKTLPSAVIALFGTYTKTHKGEMDLFNRWWDENQIDRFGYQKNNRYNALGYIPIGELAPTEDAQRFLDAASGKFDERALVSFYSDHPDIESMTIVR